MFHRIAIKISKIIFATFILTLVGYVVAVFAMSILTGYIDTTGFDTFSEQFEAMIETIESWIS